MLLLKYGKTIWNTGWHNFAKQCRGKVIDLNTRKIVVYPFNKFFCRTSTCIPLRTINPRPQRMPFFIKEIESISETELPLKENQTKTDLINTLSEVIFNPSIAKKRVNQAIEFELRLG